jgi:hypothetical protein
MYRRNGHEDATVNMRWTLGFALLCVCATASAGWVGIDPDDYQPGSQIVSPHARVLEIDDSTERPVFASVPGSNVLLPADGNSVFDLLPTARHSIDGTHMEFGLLFDFEAPVDQVQIDVLNFLYRPGLFIDCFAFAADGTAVQCGGVKGFNAAYGATSTASILFDGAGAKRLYLGGGDQIAALYFDNVRFNIPEPDTLSLFLAALAALVVPAFCRRRKKSSRV